MNDTTLKLLLDHKDKEIERLKEQLLFLEQKLLEIKEVEKGEHPKQLTLKI